MNRLRMSVLLLTLLLRHVHANDENYELELDRLDIGASHIERSNRDGDDISGSSNILFANIRGSKIIDWKGQNSLSVFPQLNIFASDDSIADYVALGDLGFYYPFWDDSTIRRVNIDNVHMGGYDFDFPPPLALEVTPGIIYSNDDGQGSDTTDWHTRLAGHFHAWFSEPKNTEDSYSDIGVSLGRDILFTDDAFEDSTEDFATILARWRPWNNPKANFEFSYNGYFSKTDFDQSGLSNQTSISHQARIQYLLPTTKIREEYDLGIYVTLSFGYNKFNNIGGNTGDDRSFNYYSPGIYIRYPLSKTAPKLYSEKPLIPGGFWTSGFGAHCFANPVCRQSIGM